MGKYMIKLQKRRGQFTMGHSGEAEIESHLFL